MSVKKTRAPRRLERFRAKHKGPKVAEPQGVGKAQVLAAKKVAMSAAVVLTKKNNKHVADLAALDVAALQEKLAEVRKELLALRFKHAVGQLENVAAIPAAKRQVARIMTVIRQKELGA